MIRRLLNSTAAVAILGVLLVLAVISVWQRDRTERRFIELLGRMDRFERSLEEAQRDLARARLAGGGGSVAGTSAEPDYILDALEDPANLLRRDPDMPWLPPEATRGATLHLHLAVNPNGFNVPAHLSSEVTELTSFTTLELARRHRSDPSRWAPELAYRVATPDDGHTYVIELRRDLVWQEPVLDDSRTDDWLAGEHPVTAHDLVFSLDLIMNPQVTGAAPLRSHFEQLESYEALDDHTLVIRFRTPEYSQRALVLSLRPVAEFLYAFDESGRRLPAETLGQSFQEHWYRLALGCGPYRMTEFEPGVRIVLERSPTFPLGGDAFDRVIYLILTSDSHVVRKLRTGELDLAYLRAAQYRTEVTQGASDSPFLDGRLVEGRWQEHSWFYVGWNLRNPLFADRRVRLALTSALDGDRILADLFGGHGQRISGPMPRFLPHYDLTIEPWPYDLERAASLLEEAGWTDSDGDGVRDKEIDGERRDFEFALLIPSNRGDAWSMAALFKEALAKVGVRMAVRTLEWGMLLKAKKDRDFDAITLAWQSDPEPDFRQIWHSSQAEVPGSSNYIGFRHPEADRLIDEMATSFEREERIRLSREFHALLHREQPYTFLFMVERPVFWRRELQNVRFGLTRPYRNHRPWFLDAPRP
jgi:peptide/nickel transport system substrate-binding protein